MQLFLKLLSGMENSVNPDQSAPGAVLFAYAICQKFWCTKFYVIYHNINQMLDQV